LNRDIKEFRFIGPTYRANTIYRPRHIQMASRHTFPALLNIKLTLFTEGTPMPSKRKTMDYAFKDWTADTATELHIRGAEKIEEMEYLARLMIKKQGALLHTVIRKQYGCSNIIVKGDSGVGFLNHGFIFKNEKDEKYLKNIVDKYDDQEGSYFMTEVIRRGGRYLLIKNMKSFASWMKEVNRDFHRKVARLPELAVVNDEMRHLMNEMVYRAAIDESWFELVVALENYGDSQWWDELGEHWEDVMERGDYKSLTELEAS